MENIEGRIHSIETCGGVDGPGIRTVIFLQGCPLRCLYCHNPDSRDFKSGDRVTVDTLLTEVQWYRSYMDFSGGGITLSGGEPCSQPKFSLELLRRCQEKGIHTALDTSGFVPLKVSAPIVEYADLILLDIKSFNPATYEKVTSVPLLPTLEFADHLEKVGKPTWVRFVLVPGLTDDPENIEGIAKFIATKKNIERVDVLPFHQMAEYKWKEMGYEYKLKGTPSPTKQQVADAIAIFESYGLYTV